MVKYMFKNYQIKNENNEIILYLEIDLNTEFTNIKNFKKNTINKEIKDYINKKNIKFYGKKIVILSAGIILATYVLKRPITTYEAPNYNYTESIILNENLIVPEEQAKEDITLSEIKEKNETPSSTINKVQENTKKPTTPVKPEQKPQASKPNTTIAKPSTSQTNTLEKNEKENNSKPAPTQNKKQMVTVYRSNGQTLNIELEEYLIGVVGSEMPASFNIEALKAQAVAARTYAIKTISDGGKLTDTVKTQVYKDNNELKKSWGTGYNTYYNKVKKAVDETKGLIMYYNNEIINAFYHSTSNGYTEDSSYVFKEYPYLVSVESPYDKNVSSYSKTINLTYEEVSNKLDIPVTSTSNIEIKRNSSNRVDKIVIDNNIYDGTKFRSILSLRSTDFDIILEENKITITTRGYGHGVGMSQYGANEYAKKGYTYDRILKHYYTGITIKKN